MKASPGVPGGVIVVDEALRIQHWTPTTAIAFGEGVLSPGADLRDLLHLVWPPGDADEVVRRLQGTLDTGEASVVHAAIEEREERTPLDAHEWQFHPIALAGGRRGLACCFTDTSRHVVARRALAESERRLLEARSRLDSTLAANEVGTWEFDVLRNTVTADVNLARIFAVPPDEAAAGRPLEAYLAAIHEDDRARVAGVIERSLGTGGHLAVECRVVRPQGICWIAARGRVERNEAGQATRLPGVLLDITGQRSAEERERVLLVETASANAKFRAFFEQGVLFAGIMAVDGTILEPNWQACEGCGFTREQVVGKPFWEGPWWAPSAVLQAQIREASARAAAGHPFRAEMPYFVADGSERMVDVSILPIKDAAGRVTFLAPTGTDITSQKRAEEALRQKAQEMQTLLDTLPVGVFIAHDAGARTITGNPAANKLIRARGANLSKTAPIDERPTHFRVCRDGVEVPASELPVQRAARGEHVQDEEVDDHFDDGTVLHTLMSAAPLYDAEGRVRGAVATVLDVSARKRAEEALREVDRHKNEFLATLAHELRNPLAPLQHGLHLMQSARADPAAVDEARTMMSRQLSHLVRLVDDLLDVSRISQGKLELRPEPVELAVVLDDAVEGSRPLIEEMGHELAISRPDQRIVIDADLTRLAQAFTNLLNNAAKFSERGGKIDLAVVLHGHEVEVSVRDEGVGIAADQLAGIFEVFSQVDRSRERSRGGLGVGLSLVKRLVEMHGGTIEARSEGPGRGSEFVVRLPVLDLARAMEQPARAADRPRSSLRVLIVDDNQDSADSLAVVLRLAGHTTCTAYDGEAATAAVTEFHPDVVLLDIGMPRIDGYETCRNLRSRPDGAEIVVIAQTGWGQEEDRQRSYAAGFDHHLVKPVDPGTLLKLLDTIPGRES